ncbi:MAG: type IV secretion system protein, partial [Rickettsiales bacterium]|nr:type IV secretion system protein [Rickettsiales bacterium]
MSVFSKDTPTYQKVLIFVGIIIVVIFMFLGGEGRGCIDANDFGEYQILDVSVQSKKDLCTWRETSLNDGEGDIEIQRCLEKPFSGTKVKAIGGNCVVTVNGGGYDVVKTALKMAPPPSSFISAHFSISGCRDDDGKPLDIMAVLQPLYDQGVDDCIKTCESSVQQSTFPNDNFEPTWTVVDVPLGVGKQFYMRAFGDIDLLGSKDLLITFQAAPYKLQNQTSTGGIFGLRMDAPLSLKGNFTVSDVLYGEIDGQQPSLARRNEFLRRGVVFLRDLPSVVTEIGKIDGELTVDGEYKGPDLTFNKNHIKCEVDESSSIGGYPVTCFTDYPVSAYKTANNTLYKLNNDLTKTNGGYVIPEGTLEYITKYPFAGFTCSTESNGGVYRRSCNIKTEALSDARYKYNTGNGIVGKGFLFTNEKSLSDTNDSYVISNINMIHPAKIMVRVWGGMGGSCKLLTKIPTFMQDDDLGDGLVSNYYETTIPANDKWYYIVDRAGEPIVFGKSIYHTLKETYEGKINNTNNDYAIDFKVVSPDFNGRSQWDVDNLAENTFISPSNSAEGILAPQVSPCGTGMVVMVLPQNDIVIKKSGLITFKNILKEKTFEKCPDIAISDDAECLDGEFSTGKQIKLYYQIINKNISSVTEVSDDLKKRNFHEFNVEKRYTMPDNTEGTKYIPITKEITLPFNLSENKWTSDDSVFARKGQVIRFTEKSWLNIVGDQSNGYDVKDAYWSYNENIKKNIGDGLVVHIEERPAFLCTGSMEEEIINSECQRVTFDDGTVACKATYSTHCSLQTNDEERARYCPTGCYKVQLGGGDSGNVSEGWGNLVTGGDGNKYQSYYIDESDKQMNLCSYPMEKMPDGFMDPMSVQKCKDCKEYLSVNDKIQQPSSNVILSQCYDLENYNGSIKELKDNNHQIQVDADINNVYDPQVFKFLGVKKLKSIFDNISSNYGTLDGMSLDIKKMDNTGKYKEYVYNSNGAIKTSKPVIVNLLVLNHDDDFKFTSFSGNIGGYNIVLSNNVRFLNGEQLAALIAHKDWGKTNLSQMCPAGSGVKCVKQWLVKYNYDKTAITGDNGYGMIDLTGDVNYRFDGSGNFVDTYNNRGIRIDNIIDTEGNPIGGSQYKDFRIFLKVYDKIQYGPKAIANGGCDLNTVPLYSEKYSCTGSGYMSLDSIYCNDTIDGSSKVINGACPTSGNTGGSCKKDGSAYVSPQYSIRERISCTGMYQNNQGGYAVQVKTPRNYSELNEGLEGFDNFSKTNIVSYGVNFFRGFSIKRILYPMLELLDGVSMGLHNDPKPFKEVNLIPCKDEHVSTKCSYYNKNTNLYDPLFGNGCVMGQDNCWETCNVLREDDPEYLRKCLVVNDNGGFTKQFYNRMITDTKFHVVVRILLAIMIAFLGLFHLLGLTEIKHEEMLKRVVKIGFIYLMIGEFGWYYYNRFIIKFFNEGMDYLVFAVTSALEPESSLKNEMIKGTFLDKSILFSTTDRNISIVLSAEVSYKVFGLLFTGVFGWLYVGLIYSALLNYIFAVMNALISYMAAKFFTSLLLSLGPIFFILLIFEKTKSSFDKWISALIGYAVTQIGIMTFLSFFNSLVYNIIKFILSYKVCWKPVWIMNLPILGSFKLLTFWDIAGRRDLVGSMPVLFRVLLIYCIADVMKGFMDIASN